MRDIILRFLDYTIFSALMLLLAGIVYSSAIANIQTDSIDYYAILQRLAQSSGNPIVRNQYFVEQRSPGYPILSLIPYAVFSFFVEPYVHTEEIIPPPYPLPPPHHSPTESMLLPPQPILVREIFFKNFYLESQGSWFEWKIIGSLLVISYGLFLLGCFFAVKCLALENHPLLGAALVPLAIITAPVFIHNLVITPAYATLAAFGISCFFTYAYVRGFHHEEPLSQFLAGFFAGLLVLTRLETIVIALIILVSLGITQRYTFLKHYLLGATIPMIVLLLYNFTQFGNPFHAGILKGDINRISLEGKFIYAALFEPRSGILFWSALVSLGIICLFFSKKQHLISLGACSLAFIALILIRVPMMYYCVGEGLQIIGGLPITCPPNMTALLDLIRLDVNRYIVVLYPFSLIGLNNLLRFLYLKLFHRPSFG